MTGLTRFTGRVIAITGGSGGIGFATAQRLGKEGAKLALLDVNDDALNRAKTVLQESNIESETYNCDIGNETSVETTFQQIKSRFTKLDGLINTAGITGLTGIKAEEVGFEDWKKVFNVNADGTFLTNRAAIKMFLENDYGRICNIASVAGKEGNPGMCAYSASKSAVLGLTKSLGKEYATTNITINAVAPAVIRTPILDAIPQSQIDYMTAKIPMQRCGELDEAAALICWIVSHECSFTTGFCFDLTGGRSTY